MLDEEGQLSVTKSRLGQYLTSEFQATHNKHNSNEISDSFHGLIIQDCL